MNKLYQLIIICLTLSLTSCGDDDASPSIADNALSGTYAMLTNVGETAGVQGNSFLQVLSEYDSTVSNATATENTNKGTIETYGDYIFFAPFFSADVKRYLVNEDHSLTLDGELVLPGVADIAVISDTKGFILQNAFELVEFNPTTFTITTTISLQQFNDKITEFPFSRAGEMFIRESDNKIFIALNYIENMTFQHIDDEVAIAVVDGNTNEVEKRITDDRSYSPGMLIGSGGQGFSIDENNDIYISCSAGYGFQANELKSPGILRIKSGTTEIDPDYFFDLNAAGVGSSVGILCIGGNEAYTFKRNLNQINDDFSNVTIAAAHRPVKINLSTKSLIGEVSGYAYTTFLNGIWMKPFNDGTKCYLPLNSDDENAVYELDFTTNVATKRYETIGAVISMELVQ
ncbi:MAG: DUF4374 domain-containing protein [Bacteroidota bacterium]